MTQAKNTGRGRKHYRDKRPPGDLAALYYTRNEAGQILKVTQRTVTNYIQRGALDTFRIGRRTLITKESVRLFLDTGEIPTAERARAPDIERLQEQLRALEARVETLTLSLGFGARKMVRKETEMKLVRTRLIDTLAVDTWAPRTISWVADELMRLQEEEVLPLLRNIGPHAIDPYITLVRRMIPYLEEHPHFERDGLSALVARLRAGRDRVYALLTAHSRANPSDEELLGEAARRHAFRLSDFEGAILAYITHTRSLRLPEAENTA